MVQPVPEGFHSVTPMILFNDIRKAIDFYKEALGAEELFAMPGPDGAVIHAEVKIGDSKLMFGSANEAWGTKSATDVGYSPIRMWLYVEDCDAAHAKALAAGCEVPPGCEVTDMFWGDRCGTVKCPFGYEWVFATHKEDLAPEEIGKRQQEWFAKMAEQGQS